MSSELEKKLETYAEVILKVGLNFQPKQRLLIGGPSVAHDGISFDMAPLVRIITKKAYQMGASLVDVVWADEQLRPLRFKYGSKNRLDCIQNGELMRNSMLLNREMHFLIL